MKKKLLVILFFIFLFIVSLKPIFAQCASDCSIANLGKGFDCLRTECTGCDFCRSSSFYTGPGSFSDFQNKLTLEDMNLEKFVGGPNGVVRLTLQQLTGELVGDDSKQLLTSVYQGMPYIEVGGLLGVTTKIVASVLTPPKASGIEYFADLGKRIGIVKPAYAQGIGFSQLGNLLPIWKAVRDASYVFFVVVFSVVGLAIMLRVKLDPKTVITIQNAIPKLVIALILITFSYAIAGLLIDLIYLIIFLGTLILKDVPQMNTIITDYGHGNIAGLQTYLSTIKYSNTWGLMVKGTVEAIFSNWTSGIAFGVGVALAIIIGLIAGGGWVIVGALVLPVLIFLIIPLVLMIKLLLKLIGVYIKIILLVITAPFQILMGVFPGSQYGFNSWFRNLLQNILVFPVISLLILLGLLLMRQTGPVWVPPGLGVNGQFLPVLIGLGMLLALNSVPDAIKAAFEKKAFPFETAIGQAIGQAYGKTKPLTKAAEVTYLSKLEPMINRGLFKSILSTLWGIKVPGEKEPGIKKDTEKTY